ncbi:vitamin B12 dependent-methionine synthase activation domain-containing protein [Chloroflexota bacterium]
MIAISEQLNIDRRQVLRYIGYDNDCVPPARMSSLVDGYIENIYDIIAPSYSYVIRDVEIILCTSAVIEGPIVFQSNVIARLLEQCEKVAVFALTIGNHLEEMVSHLTDDGLVLQASVLDAIGSVATEKVADLVHDRISRIASIHGLHTSRRFCPGYCDWEVDQQAMVFRILNGDSAGVHLTEGCIMLPRKSVSGIIGIGSADVANYSPCNPCDKHDCVGRR